MYWILFCSGKLKYKITKNFVSNFNRGAVPTTADYNSRANFPTHETPQHRPPQVPPQPHYQPQYQPQYQPHHQSHSPQVYNGLYFMLI